ncbi:ribosomal protein S27E [Desulfitispora alkaliphila]|uniref:hypothetical protein n=1 Tax=Desulfitispora alkaliphila TaxID=622674 RepID=UPI003D25D25E
MVVNTSTVVAVRCPSCGTMDFHCLSLFSFASKKVVRLKCECDTSLISIGTKDRKTFWIQINCLMCEANHMTYKHRRFIWSDQVLTLSCDETDVDVVFIGPSQQVKQEIKEQDKSLREMAEEMGFGEYFDCPEVMYEVLDILYEYAEEDKLYCQCGSFQVDIDVFADRLELRCDDCDCRGVILAENENHIKEVKEASEIKLTSKGFINLVKKGKLKRSKN